RPVGASIRHAIHATAVRMIPHATSSPTVHAPPAAADAGAATAGAGVAVVAAGAVVTTTVAPGAVAPALDGARLSEGGGVRILMYDRVARPLANRHRAAERRRARGIRTHRISE